MVSRLNRRGQYYNRTEGGVNLVVTKLAKSTRLTGSLPVFYHFYPSTRFFKISTRFVNYDLHFFFFFFFFFFEISELINHFSSYRP